LRLPGDLILTDTLEVEVPLFVVAVVAIRAVLLDENMDR
jgi:hypothetical protein